jgi:hypothetical protein
MDDDIPEALYTDFRALLLECMLQALARSKLIVEKCFVVAEGFGDWTMRRDEPDLGSRD